MSHYSNDAQRKDGKYPQCKDCRKEVGKKYRSDNSEKIKNYYLENQELFINKSKVWRINNPDKARLALQEWHKKNKDKVKNKNLSIYGITLVEYKEMLAQQKGKCYICSNEETIKTKSGEKRMLSVDHDHKSGKVRGLLCNRCNIVLGKVEDDVGLLKRAIAYIERHLTPLALDTAAPSDNEAALRK